MALKKWKYVYFETTLFRLIHNAIHKEGLEIQLNEKNVEEVTRMFLINTQQIPAKC